MGKSEGGKKVSSSEIRSKEFERSLDRFCSAYSCVFLPSAQRLKQTVGTADSCRNPKHSQSFRPPPTYFTRLSFMLYFISLQRDLKGGLGDESQNERKLSQIILEENCLRRTEFRNPSAICHFCSQMAR